MRHKDLYLGAEVYHCIFPHWGKGIVVELFRTIGGYRPKMYGVNWEHTGKILCHADDLRKTFNKKKQQLLNGIKLHSEFKKKMEDRLDG